MTRFTVNCSILFTELPLLERPAAAKAAGFDAVEFWWPFADPVPADAEVDRFTTALSDAGVQLTGLNFAAGDMPGGDRGLLSLPAHSAAFADNIDVAVGIADRTGCTALNALYGNRVDDASPAEQDALATVNLEKAARAADRIGAIVLVEALNAIESPRYPLVSSAETVALIDRIHAATGADNLRFLADFYHLARMGEQPLAVIHAHADRIGHVQIADTPGRNQPGTGDFDFTELFEGLEANGYGGWVGLEYKPLGASADSFDWIKRTEG